MIFVAGSANLDFVVRAAHIPAPGETVLGRDFKTYPGGKGANQAVASARAGGVTTHMLLALGADAHATTLEQSLQQAGVHCHIVRDAQQATGTAFICVSDDAENAITVAPGANQSLRAADLPALDGFSHLLLQLETPLASVAAYARAARAQGVTVVLNAAPAQALDDELLALIDVLIVNQGELATVARHQGSIAECLAGIAVPTVVVTLGAHGCCARFAVPDHVRHDVLGGDLPALLPAEHAASVQGAVWQGRDVDLRRGRVDRLAHRLRAELRAAVADRGGQPDRLHCVSDWRQYLLFGDSAGDLRNTQALLANSGRDGTV